MRTPRKLAISRAPLRISFVGGGSDLPGGRGATVSSAIDKHVYVMAKWRYDDLVILNWQEKETVEDVKALKHELVRGALLVLGVRRGIEISTFADVPGVGSGLGSSAATTVAALQAVAALKGIGLPPLRLAEMASEIELVRLQKEGGRQDQYISAFGGMRSMDHQDSEVTKNELVEFGESSKLLLREGMILFRQSPGEGRSANQILGTFNNSLEFREACLQLRKDFLHFLPRLDFGTLGKLIFDHHTAKCKAFSRPDIDLCYMGTDVQHNLDIGGFHYKLCGAGGNGHLLVCTEPERREQAVEHFTAWWGPELPFEFVDYGARIIHSE